MYWWASQLQPIYLSKKNLKSKTYLSWSRPEVDWERFWRPPEKKSQTSKKGSRRRTYIKVDKFHPSKCASKNFWHGIHICEAKKSPSQHCSGKGAQKIHHRSQKLVESTLEEDRHGWKRQCFPIFSVQLARRLQAKLLSKQKHASKAVLSAGRRRCTVRWIINGRNHVCKYLK